MLFECPTPFVMILIIAALTARYARRTHREHNSFYIGDGGGGEKRSPNNADLEALRRPLTQMNSCVGVGDGAAADEIGMRNRRAGPSLRLQIVLLVCVNSFAI